MKIELLYFDGCPNFLPTLNLVNEVVAELGLDAKIVTTPVRTQQEARAREFLGSPSVRVDDTDIEIHRPGNPHYTVSCRVYQDESGMSGIPSRQLLRAALLSRQSPGR